MLTDKVSLLTPLKLHEQSIFPCEYAVLSCQHVCAGLLVGHTTTLCQMTMSDSICKDAAVPATLQGVTEGAEPGSDRPGVRFQSDSLSKTGNALTILS